MASNPEAHDRSASQDETTADIGTQASSVTVIEIDSSSQGVSSRDGSPSQNETSPRPSAQMQIDLPPDKAPSSDGDGLAMVKHPQATQNELHTHDEMELDSPPPDKAPLSGEDALAVLKYLEETQRDLQKDLQALETKSKEARSEGEKTINMAAQQNKEAEWQVKNLDALRALLDNDEKAIKAALPRNDAYGQNV